MAVPQEKAAPPFATAPAVISVPDFPRPAISPLDDIAAERTEDLVQPPTEVVLVELAAARAHAEHCRRVAVRIGIDRVGAAGSGQRRCGARHVVGVEKKNLGRKRFFS
jgi:hypothetical protein